MATPSTSLTIHPPDDPGCDLVATVYLPDPGSLNYRSDGVYPGCLVVHGGGFEGNPNSPQTTQCHLDMADAGFMSVRVTYRLTLKSPGQPNPERPPGQTTDGTYPQQINDVVQWVGVVRNDSRCNGNFVCGVGGSAGGNLVTQAVGTGVQGDTRLDAAVSISGAYDFSDRTAGSHWNYGPFTALVEKYGASTDLTVLRSKSPVGVVDSGSNPQWFFHTWQDPMPFPQQELMTGQLDTLGVTNYQATTFGSVSDPRAQHSFANWPVTSNNVRSFAIPYLQDLAGLADDGGGGGDPGPGGGGGGELLPYTAVLTGGNHDPLPVIPGDALTFDMTGLDPGVTYTLSLVANNSMGSSPPAVVTFLSDRGSAGGGGGQRKFAPKGVYELLVDPVEVQTQGVWDATFMDGVRLQIGWDTVQPTSKTGFDFTLIDAFADHCRRTRKKGGLTVYPGIRTPTWVLALGVKLFTGIDAVTYPLPWDAILLDEWEQFVTALGARYDANSGIAYVTVAGMGRGATGLLNNSTADSTELNAMAITDGFPSLSNAYTGTTIMLGAAYNSAFPSTPLLFPLATPFADPSAGQTITDVVNGVYTDRTQKLYGLMVTDLTATSFLSPSLTDAALIARSSRDTKPYGGLMLYDSTNPLEDTTQVGTYDPELAIPNVGTAAVSMKLNFIELYPSDVDSADPYPTDIAAVGAALKARPARPA